MRDSRFRLLILAILGLMVATVWFFPTWYPILNPNTVSIAYPGLELEAQADFTLLPQAVKDAYLTLRDGDKKAKIDAQPTVALALLRARLLGIDVVAPDNIQTAVIPTDATLIKKGTFITPDLTRGATGDVTIFQTADLQRYVRLDNDFSVTRAPDIHIIFTRNPDPYDNNGVGVDYLDVGSLVYNVGTQTYLVPVGVDFAQYPILVLYSPTLNFVISSATLR